MSSREIIKALKKAGWQLIRVSGDHHIFRHPTLPGMINVTHPRKDVSPKVLRDARKVSGLPLR